VFVDQADIQVLAGDGGRGCISFRRESHVPLGGPDGGDGGDGGSVFLEATPGVDTLLDMVGRHHWSAERGEHGLGKKMAGKDGAELIIRVPPGTLVYDADSSLLIADLKQPGMRVRVAKGGKGGKGNIHFVNSVRQAPDFAEPGKKGQVRNLHLELRLIADVGFVGLPNAGKSTLLSRLSAAKPKIADYPFTTLSPQIGIAPLDADRRLVLADIPGLIEGASHGKGLGLDFLRHIERTRVIVHLIDILPLESGGGVIEPIKAYKQIRKELEAYSPKLARKPEILVANKMDLAGAQQSLADLRSALPGKMIYAISGVAGSGLRPLLEAIWQQVQRTPPAEPFLEKAPVLVPLRKAEEGPEIVYEAAESNPDDWEADEGELELDPGEESIATRAKGKKSSRAVSIESDDARGTDSGERQRPRHVGKKKKKARTMIEAPQFGSPSSKKKRVTAATRKAAHKARVMPQPSAPEPSADAELAAEIAAMKADDQRKGKYYNRKKDI
jgi:GTP-binding protein